MIIRKAKSLHKYTNKELSKKKWDDNRSILQYIKIMIDIIKSKSNYEIGSKEYIEIDFYDLPPERREIVTLKTERDNFVKVFNNKEIMPKLENKKEFMNNFKDYTNRDFLILEDASFEDFESFYMNNKGFVAKKSDGRQGKDVQIIRDINNLEDEYNRLLTEKFDLVEEIVSAHPQLKKVTPHGLPPIRIITFLDKNGTTHILATGLFISGNDLVVNGNRGASMAIVNSKTGEVVTDALNSAGEVVKRHKDASVRIKGYQIPSWDKVIQLVTQAAKEFPDVRYIGWDLSISEKGPLLIEANAQNPAVSKFYYKNFDQADEKYTNFEIVKSAYEAI